MKDIKGNELKVGDEVAFAYKDILSTGKITKFYKSKYDKDECSVGRVPHVDSSRILKLTK